MFTVKQVLNGNRVKVTTVVTIVCPTRSPVIEAQPPAYKYIIIILLNALDPYYTCIHPSNVDNFGNEPVMRLFSLCVWVS